MSYLPNTDADRRAMLGALGLASVDELFEDIPEAVREKARLSLPSGLSESALLREVEALVAENQNLDTVLSFLGAGCYDHFVPSVVDHIVSRGEFSTAYTPYQPEVSQGTLQVIYEFQTLVARLMNMDVANASLYDGASALAEAAMMALAIKGRNRVVICRAVHPAYRQVVRTHLQGGAGELTEVGFVNGVTDLSALKEGLAEDVAAVIIQQPNFLGCLERAREVSSLTHNAGALLIACVDPISLALIQAPGDYDADLAVGEGQPLGLHPSYGGPFLGLMACRKEFVRRMPGRLVGLTRDVEGRRGFVLTLQTREQHIRRERATSNICTDQGLCALAATVYLTIMGPRGLRQAALLSSRLAHEACAAISTVRGFVPAFPSPFFKEFAVRSERPVDEVLAHLQAQGILGGYPLGREYPDLADCFLVAVTERRTSEDIEHLREVLGGCRE